MAEPKVGTKEFGERSSRRLAAIRQSQKDGSLGPFAPDPKPKNHQKLSPLSDAAAYKDRRKQEQDFGMTRGRNSKYTGD